MIWEKLEKTTLTAAHQSINQMSSSHNNSATTLLIFL